MTDHARGCEVRTYTCTCGYDDQRDAADGQRDALMAELARALHGLLTALDEERAHFSDEYNSAVAALTKYEGANK